MADKENILTKTYDLMLYIIPQLSKFPRDQRFLLADRIESMLLDFLEDMIASYYGSEKLTLIEKGNLRLEKIRYMVRLSKDLHFIDLRRYELITERIDEIGRMLGGWRKSLSGRK
jgi:hypothetical protein